jgi:hypothetical protein
VSDLSRIEARLSEIVGLLRWLVEETRKGNAGREEKRFTTKAPRFAKASQGKRRTRRGQGGAR